MKQLPLIITSIACFIIGVISLAVQREWIIIRFTPFATTHVAEPIQPRVRKKVQLFFWQHNAWHTENTEILMSENKTDSITYLINNWLSVLDDEQISTKQITLQSVLLSANGHEAYLSFDRNPLNKDDSTYKKWMWIEGLLKTLRENEIKLQSIHFLVHHQPLNDYHLDFSNPWPLYGFIKQ